MAALAALIPVRASIDPDSTVTAGNASGQNDGAALCVVTTEEEAARRGLTPLLELRSWAVAGVGPEVMGLGPVPATDAALRRAGLTFDDLDLIELNEAFAAQVLAVLRSRCKNPWLDEPVAPEDLDAAAESERGPERIAASKEALAAVLEALRARLSDQGLAMFQWLYVEERSVDEVCALAETSESAVYAWRSRLGKLVRQIAGEVLSDRGAKQVSAGRA